MPGILPMKVIRVPNSTQQRIAQACDRCRSKKIRCDGVRPCCTQCSNVGFECKTSDKLSRRAFPRGYTESLEDRVRGLEAEVRELKDLLDEKDEKIDMLSRIHNFSPASRKNSTSLSPTNSAQIKAELESVGEDVFQVEAPALGEPSASSFGASSAAAFIEAFDGKLQETGKEASNPRPSTFTIHSRPTASAPGTGPSIPPRILSDQFINVFFQEWQPLFPVLHRPTFLRTYEEYLRDPESGLWQSNKHAVAQLYLIFDIAALSSTSQSKLIPTTYDLHWRKALHSTSSTASIPTIQCNVLAQLYYLLKADYAHLARHRAVAVSMCHQLGLHQIHKIQTLPPLEAETRKKVFWCEYVLDKFTSAATGTPMLINEADVTTEFPADVDDENLSAQGFSPTLPGELTKISSGLALFQVSKILSKTLQQLYPSRASYQLSLSKLNAISDELDQWQTNLPSHLRLQFAKDKPSTNTISCRSPLLSLAYFYVKGLIHRPLVCHGSGNSASTSTLTLATGAKHILQILDLLDERRMNYTFPVNKSELLLCSGFSLLWHCLDLEEDSKLIKDNQKTLSSLVDMMAKDSALTGEEFYRYANGLIKLPGRRPSAGSQAMKQTNMDSRANSSMPAPAETKSKSARRQLQAIASRFSSSSSKPKADVAPRRATGPLGGASMSVSPQPRAHSTISLPSNHSTPPVQMSLPSVNRSSTQSRALEPAPNVNLDYLPLGDEDNIPPDFPPKENSNLDNMTDSSWEQLLCEFDNGNIYNGIYGDQYSNSNPNFHNIIANNASSTLNHSHDRAARLSSPHSLFPSESPSDWTTSLTNSSTTHAAATVGDQNAWASVPSLLDLSQLPYSNSQLHHAPVPQSVLSFSEESLTSCEDLVFSACGSTAGAAARSESSRSESAGLGREERPGASLAGGARRKSGVQVTANKDRRNSFIQGISIPADEDVEDEFVDFT